MQSLIEKVSSCDPGCKDVRVPYGAHRHRNKHNDLVLALVDALERNPHCVRKVDFVGARRTPELFRRLAALFRAKTVIEHVRLPSGTSNEQLLLIVDESLRDNNATVRVLDLHLCDIRGRQGGEIIRTLLLHNGTISEIILKNNRLATGRATCLAEALRSDRCRLKKLDFSGCSIGNDGARELSTALAGSNNNSTLEVLNIADNGISFTGARHVLGMLETNSVLRVLVLRGNLLNQGRTPGVDTTVGDVASRALKSNASLRELDLKFCKLAGTDLSCVFRALAGDENNNSLSRLRVVDNDMDETSTTTLARSLPQMKGLEEIHFTWYRGGVCATVLRGFLEGLRDNNSLVRIQTECEYRLQQWGEDGSLSSSSSSSRALWQTWSKFVARRNKIMRIPLFDGNDNGKEASLPQSLWPYMLNWCNNGRYGYMETTKASLVHHVLCTRANDIFGLVLLPRATPV